MRTSILRPAAPSQFSARTAGFSLVEAAVAVAVAGVAVLITLAVVGNMGSQLTAQRFGAMGQDNVRVAVDEMTRDLRSAGSGSDYSAGQGRFVYAGPFTVAFNANLSPADDDPASAPTAINADGADASVPLDGGETYTPPATYSTGAETVVLTLDSNRDGVVDAADAADQEDETDSRDASDYVVAAYSYGADAGTNAVQTRGLGLVRGPATASDAGAREPLFKYWIDDDNDPSTAAVLHGDTDADGSLSSSEIAALDPVASGQLALIERIDVAAQPSTKQAQSAAMQADGGTVRAELQPPVLRSTVSFRNRNTTAARVVGTVYADADQDGVQDSGESVLRDVLIRCSNGASTHTTSAGTYQFVLSPGTYTITEVDPAGYSSTTSNAVSVSPEPGAYTTVNFGDYTASGYIRGTVYNDEDRDGRRDSGERRLHGIRILLDTGNSTTTNNNGDYSFIVPIGTYVVTEEDSTTYASTTSNIVDANIRAAGDSVRVDFGDYKLADTGTIHGIVYLDADNDAVRDATETGVANVRITLDDGQVASTNTTGEFRFTAQPGHHRVTEVDPAGYTSSTVNSVDVEVLSQQTVEVLFGDITQQDVQFQEITLGNTQNALSLATIDTNEDTKADLDLVLGTHYVGGSNDILVWWNGRTSASTPNSAIFSTTPSYQRVVSTDVNALAAKDLNGDGFGDIITGLGAATNNLNPWIMQSSGSNKGKLPTSPTTNYTAFGALGVYDVAIGKCDANAFSDLIVGQYSSATTGALEIWHGSSDGSSYTRSTRNTYLTVPGTSSPMGAVRTIAVADFNGDGYTDIVAGAQTSTTASNVYLLLYVANGNDDYQLASTIPVTGIVQDVRALDMMEDGSHDVDILIATALGTGAGEVQVWHNRGDNTFGEGDTANQMMSDSVNPGGVPLCMSTPSVDNDVFPDLIVGTRSATFAGQVVVYRGFGYLPANGTVISTTSVGEVITSTIGDFNKDGAPDLAIGTRTASSTGKVVVYFNVRPAS